MATSLQVCFRPSISTQLRTYQEAIKDHLCGLQHHLAQHPHLMELVQVDDWEASIPPEETPTFLTFDLIPRYVLCSVHNSIITKPHSPPYISPRLCRFLCLFLLLQTRPHCGFCCRGRCSSPAVRIRHRWELVCVCVCACVCMGGCVWLCVGAGCWLCVRMQLLCARVCTGHSLMQR